MISGELVLPKLDRFGRKDLLQMLKSKSFPYEKLEALKHASHLSSRLWPVPATGEGLILVGSRCVCQDISLTPNCPAPIAT